MAEVILLNSLFFSNLSKQIEFFRFFLSFQIFECFKIFENFKRSWWLNRTELTKRNNIWSHIRYRIPPSVVALKSAMGPSSTFFEILKNFKKSKNSEELKKFQKCFKKFKFSGKSYLYLQVWVHIANILHLQVLFFGYVHLHWNLKFVCAHS